jgi:CheY-like chemotaxis protein
VLANLLTNAAKYTEPEGQIRLRATCAEDTLTIAVSDSGIGIPPDELSRLFTMFSQVKSGREYSEGGLGIGLALAKGIIDLHGGTVEAYSAGLGQGSEFLVRLPLRAMRSARSTKTVIAPPGPFMKRRVLIADDNRDAADSLALLLRMDGHDVTVVNDGQEALRAFTTVQPQVALLDIGMPKMDGYEIARQVRQSSFGQAVTLIAVTGWGQDGDKARALAAGFNHHFTKPIEPDRLTELMRS